MKKLLLTGLAIAGLAASTFAQGYFIFNDSLTVGGIATGTAGNYQSFTGGIEVWEANTAAGAVPANLATILGATPTSGGVQSAYGLLTGDGFKLESTFSPASIVGGTFASPAANSYINMPDAQGTVALAMFVWNGTGSSFSAAGATAVGFTAWTQATGNYLASPTPAAPPDTQSSDAVMVPVPEPSMLALAGLGAAALLIFRRRK